MLLRVFETLAPFRWQLPLRTVSTRALAVLEFDAEVGDRFKYNGFALIPIRVPKNYLVGIEQQHDVACRHHWLTRLVSRFSAVCYGTGR